MSFTTANPLEIILNSFQDGFGFTWTEMRGDPRSGVSLMLEIITAFDTVASRDNILARVTAAFAQWNEVILGQCVPESSRTPAVGATIIPVIETSRPISGGEIRRRIALMVISLVPIASHCIGIFSAPVFCGLIPSLSKLAPIPFSIFLYLVRVASAPLSLMRPQRCVMGASIKSRGFFYAIRMLKRPLLIVFPSARTAHPIWLRPVPLGAEILAILREPIQTYRAFTQWHRFVEHVRFLLHGLANEVVGSLARLGVRSVNYAELAHAFIVPRMEAI